MKIFLDDQAHNERKNWIPDGWRVAINFEEFKSLIDEASKSGERIDALSLDNDLGENSGELTEGLEIMKWMSEKHPELFRAEIRIHSQNNVARENMEAKLKLWQKHVEDLIEARELPHPFGEIKKVR